MAKQKSETHAKAWPASAIEMRRVDELVPYARNARTHSPEQVSQIAASIREWGWTTPVLVAEDDTILAGHGRLMAARQLGIAEVPTMVARGWSEAQRRAYVLADNQLALNSGWDSDLLRVELEGLKELDFDLDVIGFDADELKELLEIDAEPEKLDELSDQYTNKIEAPIYEITGERPAVSDLIDRSKTLDLQAEIDRAEGLPDDVRDFLRHAAERHTVLDFRNIAEFYAHADAATQRLMERSALVIIDFDQAIENGFVKLTKLMGDMASVEDVEA